MNTATTLATTPVFGEGGLIGTNGTIKDTTPPELKPILFPSERQIATQRRIIEARKYHEGLFGSKVPKVLRQAFGEDCSEYLLSLNFIAAINRAIGERLNVEGFVCETKSQEEQKRQEEWAQEVFDGSRMRGKMPVFVLEAVRDGQAFVLVDPDKENGRARWTPHLHYTDATLGGDGEGVLMFYPNDDTDQKPIFACKRWTERSLTGGVETPRITVYYEHLIRKWVYSGTEPLGWQLLSEINWTHDDTAARYDAQGKWIGGGRPLGIPVIHWKAPDLLPAARLAYGAQRGLDRTYVEMLSGAEIDLIRLGVALGWEPEVDDIEAGTIIGTSDKGPGEASFEMIEGSDATRYIQFIDKQIALMSDLTNTPLTLVQRSAQRAAEGTLQEEKESFFAKVGNYAAAFAMGIEDALKKSRTVANVFFKAGLDEEAPLRVEWKPFGGNKTTAEKLAEAELVQAQFEAAAAAIDAGAQPQAAYLAVGFEADMAERLSKTWADNAVK